MSETESYEEFLIAQIEKLKQENAILRVEIQEWDNLFKKLDVKFKDYVLSQNKNLKTTEESNQNKCTHTNIYRHHSQWNPRYDLCRDCKYIFYGMRATRSDLAQKSNQPPVKRV